MSKLVIIAVLLGSLTSAHSQEAAFGPQLYVEKIVIQGNDHTDDEVIEEVLPIQVGMSLRASDPRLRATKNKVLSLGFFRSVHIKLEKGSARGRYIVEIHVVERGTVVLDKLLFGRSMMHPWWAGIEASELNLLGQGLVGGAGAVFAPGESVEGNDHQFASILRLAMPRIGNSQWGAGMEMLYTQAAEPYRLTAHRSNRALDYRAYQYNRSELSAFGLFRPSPFYYVRLSVRSALLRAQVPSVVIRDDNVSTSLGMLDGESHLTSFRITVGHDNRPNPALPYTGMTWHLSYETSQSWLASDYHYQRLEADFGKWWPINGKKHSISFQAKAGIYSGRGPRFTQFHESQFTRLATPRVYGLLLSTQPPFQFFRAQPLDPFGEVGGTLKLEYSYHVFDKWGRVFGGRVFVGAGVWALTSMDNLQARDQGFGAALPIDLTLDAGFRFDTEIGVFEFTIANALGRMPTLQ